MPLDVRAFDDAGCRALASEGVEAAEEAAQEVKPAGAVAAVLVRRKAPGWARVWRILRSAATKLTRPGSCPEWVAAWAIRDRTAY